MNNISPVLFTKNGLEELKKEYEELVKIKRPQAVARVAVARDQGDLSENSEYASARQDLSFIDGRIVELEEILKNTQIISQTNGKKEKVDVGCRVTVKIDSKKEIFTIVGEWEANPMDKKISHASPLGIALLGKKVGEKIEVSAPAGKLPYTILAIE